MIGKEIKIQFYIQKSFECQERFFSSDDENGDAICL